MASVEITINGILYDKLSKTARAVALIGEGSLTGVGVGGGPIVPGEEPPGIWGPPGPWPTPPIYLPPGQGPHPEHPIVLPPEQVPPGMKPPTPVQPGDPTTPVPGSWPVNPMTPPQYLVINYPGVGPVYVAPPLMPEAQNK